MVFVGTPFFLLAIVLTDIWGAIGFLGSFFILRSKINGYHAKTPMRCMIASIFLEIVFLGVVYPHIAIHGAIIVMVVASVLIFMLAPFNDPNIHLSRKEVTQCKNSARARILLLLVVSLVAIVLNMGAAAKGIASGCAMAVLLLCSAYVLERRCKNGKIEDTSSQCAEWRG